MDEIRLKTPMIRKSYHPRAALWLMLALSVAMGCSHSVTKANFDKVKPGMTQAEVEAILGPPTKVYQDILIWSAGNDAHTITVTLDDRDLVSEKSGEGLK